MMPRFPRPCWWFIVFLLSVLWVLSLAGLIFTGAPVEGWLLWGTLYFGAAMVLTNFVPGVLEKTLMIFCMCLLTPLLIMFAPFALLGMLIDKVRGEHVR